MSEFKVIILKIIIHGLIALLFFELKFAQIQSRYRILNRLNFPCLWYLFVVGIQELELAMLLLQISFQLKNKITWLKQSGLIKLRVSILQCNRNQCKLFDNKYILFEMDFFQFDYDEADDQNYIIDLSHLPPQQILSKIKNLLQQEEYDKFTLLLKKNPNKQKKSRMFPLKTSNLNEKKSLEKRTMLSLKNSLRNSSSGDDQYMFKNSFSGSMSSSGFYEREKQNIMISQFEQIIQPVELYIQGNYEQAIQILLNIEFQIIQNNQQYWRENNEFQENQKQRDDVKIVRDSKLYGQVTFHLANCYYRMKNYDQAIKYYKKEVVDQSQSIKGQRMNNLGSCYAVKQQLLLSLKYYGEAWKIYQKIQEIDSSNLLNNIGILYFKTGMNQNAEKYFLESINARKGKPRNEQVLYFSYFKMGQCLKYQKKYQESLSSFLFAMNIAEKAKSSEQKTGKYSNTLKQLGLIYQIMQKWQEALSNYQKLSQAEDNSEIGQSYIYERVANIHKKLGNENEFKKFIKLSYEQYRRQGNVRKMSQLSLYKNNSQAVNSQ